MIKWYNDSLKKYGENDFERILEDLANGKVDEDTKNLKEDLEKLVNRVGNKIKKDLEKAEKADKNAGKGNTVQDIEIMDKQVADEKATEEPEDNVMAGTETPTGDLEADLNVEEDSLEDDLPETFELEEEI